VYVARSASGLVLLLNRDIKHAGSRNYLIGATRLSNVMNKRRKDVDNRSNRVTVAFPSGKQAMRPRHGLYLNFNTVEYKLK